ncbi:hypothetical protein P3102_00640 [Amycolatopsis sp. QT-25]|nr:hypothetical protein [Amycolatopsis sp. QT-25]WET79803.1 hypothetical protein P3102_00640 [Amycolatopsis sp. QT-25]
MFTRDFTGAAGSLPTSSANRVIDADHGHPGADFVSADRFTFTP